MGDCVEPSNRARTAVDLGVVAFGIFVILLTGTYEPARDPIQTDALAYRDIAKSGNLLAPGVRRPFAYRVFAPALASALPFDVETSFRIVSIAAFLGLAFAALRFLRHALSSDVLAGALTATLLLNRHFVGYPLWTVYQSNDLIALALLFVALDALYASRWGLFGVAFAASQFARETSLLLVPVAVVLLAERRSLRANARSFFIALVPGIAVFVALRLAIEPKGGRGLFENFVAAFSFKAASAEAWLRTLVTPFAPLTLIPIVRGREANAFFRQRPHLALLFIATVAASFFGFNTERLMAPAGVVFLLFVGHLAQAPMQPTRLRAFFAIVMLSAIAANAHHISARFRLPSQSATAALVALSLVMATLASLMLSGPRRAASPPSDAARGGANKTHPSTGR